jgi:lysophospholipase L1-like esterase
MKKTLIIRTISSAVLSFLALSTFIVSSPIANAVSDNFARFRSILVNVPDSWVKTSKPSIKYVGRFDFSDPAGPKFSWPASTITANFEGSEASVKIKSSGDNWFNIIIDNNIYKTFNVNKTSKTLKLASGLSFGKHTVTIVKRTESCVGTAQFLGFDFGTGKLLEAPQSSARRIEFIGDSTTSGYGNEGKNQYVHFLSKTENAYMTYSSITARNLGAEQHLIAASGKGLVVNGDNSKINTIRDLYLRTIFEDSKKQWNFSNWTPQVVVINLGSNDMFKRVDKDSFKNGYKNFIFNIRKKYPDAHIFCTVGPMLYGELLKKNRECVQNMVNELNSSGDYGVHFVEFPHQTAADGYGSDGHPSVKTHQKMANVLTEAIRNALGW